MSYQTRKVHGHSRCSTTNASPFLPQCQAQWAARTNSSDCSSGSGQRAHEAESAQEDTTSHQGGACEQSLRGRMEVCFWRTGNRQGTGGTNGKSEGSEVWPEQGSADAGEVCLHTWLGEAPDSWESWTDLRRWRILKQGESRIGTGCISGWRLDWESGQGFP